MVQAQLTIALLFTIAAWVYADTSQRAELMSMFCNGIEEAGARIS
jgi:hypothetical protein